ncbi:MAG: thermostable hemolysin, partial [Gallionellaceae bacterium]|nr:thermostable hemolysin [Gallionellaceae bacterium]
PARLPDGGASWGRYYDGGPAVYAGDILAGYQKLHGAAGHRHGHLKSLLETAWELGAQNLLRGSALNWQVAR